MTNQEAFTRIVTHLRRQGKHSLHPKGGPRLTQKCAYRAPTGERCAVGVLLTDEFYTPALEGCAVMTPVMMSVLNQALPGVSLDLLQAMQHIHDGSLPKTWELLWARVAREMNLQMPPVVADLLTVSTVEEVMHAPA